MRNWLSKIANNFPIKETTSNFSAKGIPNHGIFNGTLTLALLVHVTLREVIDFTLDCCDTESLAA